MPKQNLKKSMQDYVSKIKKSKFQFTSKSLSFSKNLSISSCKHVRTASIAAGDNNTDRSLCKNSDAAKLSDIDRFLYENFKSLYVKNQGEFKYDDEIEKDLEGENLNGMAFDESPRLTHPPPDLCGSNTFFVNPSFSGNLMEEARLSLVARSSVDSDNLTEETRSIRTVEAFAASDASTQNEVKLPNQSIAILQYSPSPYGDFGRSMKEMVEAKMQSHGRVDWDFMEELLLCYLNLNEKKSHKHILSAFADLNVVMRSGKAPARSRNVLKK